jgi:hypothetical protein
MPRRPSRRPSPRRDRSTAASRLALRLASLMAWIADGAARLLDRIAGRIATTFDRLLPPGSVRLRRAEIAAMSLFGIALAIGLLWGVPTLSRHADTLSRERDTLPSGPQVAFVQDLAWLPVAEHERLAATVAAELAGRSVLDHEALASAATALAATGWFDGPPRLRRAARHLVEIDAPWRIAAALVRDGGHDHLVDSSGHRLPLAWPAGTGPRDLVVVEGLAEGVPGRPGDRWPGGTLPIVLRVLPDLAGHEWSDQIAAIDASAVAAGGPIVLETARGGRLIWGRPDAGAAEVPVATRIAWLDALQAGNGSIDPPPARQFDLRLDYLATAPRRIAVR